MRTFVLVTSIAFLLAACGNKGALVLPDKQDQAAKQDQQDKDAAKKAAEPAAKQQ